MLTRQKKCWALGKKGYEGCWEREGEVSDLFINYKQEIAYESMSKWTGGDRMKSIGKN